MVLLVSLGLGACNGAVAPSDGSVPQDARTSAPDASSPDDGGATDDAGTATDAGDGGARDASVGPDASGGGAVTFLPRYPLEARYPEGGIFDVASDSFFVGSLGDGSVHRVDAASGSEEVFFREDAPGTWWTLGMDVDPIRRRLFVCAMDDRRDVGSGDPPYLGYVWVFDLETGARIANHDSLGRLRRGDVYRCRRGTRRDRVRLRLRAPQHLSHRPGRHAEIRLLQQGFSAGVAGSRGTNGLRFLATL